jgi:type IX secretion system PorP/SprF family membrane protein
MKTPLPIVLTTLVGIFHLTVAAQQDPQFAQFMDNTVYVNPAYAGSADRMIIHSLSRFQWAGFKGAPITNTLAVNTPLRYRSVGIGGSLVYDKFGPVTNTLCYADFSYTLFLKNDLRLSFGLKGGVNILNVNVSELTRIDEGDVLLSQNIQNDITPNFGFGIYLRRPNWYVGFSSPKLISYKPSTTRADQYQQVQHYYAIAGFVTRLSDDLKLRPAALFKFTPGAPFALDLNVALILQDRIWVGALYRLNESAGVLFQYQITPQLKAGYAFEYSTTKIVRNTVGSHELLLSYDLVFMKKKVITPRYF